MHCHEFTQRLMQVLDDRHAPDDDPQLAAHAEQCPTCGARLGAWNQLQRGLQFHSLPPRVPLVAGVLARRSREHQRWAAIAVATAALAAGLLVMVRAGGLTQPHHQAAAPAVARGDADELLSLAPGNAPAAAAIPREASSEAASEADEYRALLRTVMTRLSLTQLDELDGVDEIAGGLRPVATTLNAAIGALRRSLPVGAAAQTDEAVES